MRALIMFCCKSLITRLHRKAPEMFFFLHVTLGYQYLLEHVYPWDVLQTLLSPLLHVNLFQSVIAFLFF